MKHDSRNLKYGATSVIISVVLVAAIVVVNFLFSALSARYSFYTDMTGESNYTITEEVREALHAVEDEVNIIFCHDRDYIEQSSEMHDIMITAEYLADEFSWLNVKYINSVADPLAVQKYTLNQSEAVLQTHVIVESGEEYLKLNYKTFYVVDSDNTTVWGLKAEEKFASAILSVTADEKPVAYYTNTHGEEVSEKLLELVENAGYEAKPIDLTQEDIRAEARLIIINGPKYDFSSGYEYTEEENGEITVEKTADELAKIDKFLTQDNGSLMVFLDPRMDDLPELEKYLKEWGIVFDNNIVIDKTQSITQSGGAVVGEYCTDDTLASNLINEIAELETKPKTIFNKTGTISIADTFTAVRAEDTQSQTGLGAPTGAYASSVSYEMRDISPVFRASRKALSFGDRGTAEEAGSAAGSYLMTISRQTKIVDDYTFSSYVLAAGTVCFDDDRWIDSNVYANRDVIYAALRQFGRENVPSGIGFKEYSNTKVEDMLASEANSWTVILVSVLPLAFTVSGAVIIIRRKYK